MKKKPIPPNKPAKAKPAKKPPPKESLPAEKPKRWWKTGPKFRLTVEQIEAALEKHKGRLNKAAEELEVSEGTLFNYRRRFPQLKEAWKKAKLQRAVSVEGVLLDLVHNPKIDPNARIRAGSFYLNSQGKMIGYGPQKQEQPKGDYVPRQATIDVTLLPPDLKKALLEHIRQQQVKVIENVPIETVIESPQDDSCKQ